MLRDTEPALVSNRLRRAAAMVAMLFLLSLDVEWVPAVRQGCVGCVFGCCGPLFALGETRFGVISDLPKIELSNDPGHVRARNGRLQGAFK